MPYAEYRSWLRYKDKYGTLNVAMRLDRGIGRALAHYFSSQSRRHFSIADFSPYDENLLKNMPLDEQIDTALSHFPRH